MSEKVQQSPKKGRKGLIIGIIIILIIALIAYLLFFVWGTASGISSLADRVADIAGGVAESVSILDKETVDTTSFIRNMHLIVLRNDDFPIDYKHTSNTRLSNEEIIGEMTVEKGKTYIIQSGRVDGWDTYIDKVYTKDIGPSIYQTRVEIFETTEGAEKAFSPEWLWVYTNPEKAPDKFIDENCQFGDECLLFTYTDLTPGSTTVKVRWDVVFRHKNIIAWVFVKGTDIETFEQDALDGAQVVYDRILALE
jgi:hypothetical protein